MPTEVVFSSLQWQGNANSVRGKKYNKTNFSDGDIARGERERETLPTSPPLSFQFSRRTRPETLARRLQKAWDKNMFQVSLNVWFIPLDSTPGVRAIFLSEPNLEPPVSVSTSIQVSVCKSHGSTQRLTSRRVFNRFRIWYKVKTWWSVWKCW